MSDKKRSRRPAGILHRDTYSADQIFTALAGIKDPDMMLEKAGIQRHQLKMLEYDDEISGALETRREAVLGVPWRVELIQGGDGSPESEQALFIHDQLAPIMDTLIRSTWGATPYGYSITQVKFSGDSNNTVIDWVREVPIEDFKPQSDGGLKMRSAVNGEFRRLSRAESNSFLLTRRNSSWTNPYGEALLSRLYWPWFFRHNGWSMWMKFLERFGDPLLIGKGHDPQAMVDALTELGFEAVLAVGVDEEIQTAVATSSKDSFDVLEKAIARRIQKLILGQTLTSEVGDKGSYAAAQVHNEVRMDKRNADIRLVSCTVQKLVDTLWSANEFPGKPPRFIMDDGKGLQTERAKRDAELVKSGALRLSEDYFLRVYDFEKGDFIIPDVGEAIPARLSATAPLSLQAAQTFTPAQREVESGVTEVLAAAQNPIDPALLKSAVLAAKSPEDLEERLALLLDQQTGDFTELLTASHFAAELLGYVQEREE